MDNQEGEGKVVEARRIEVVYLKATEIGQNFGNPRKISPKKKAELRESLKEHGDFGVYVIDENNDVIAGNQRLKILIEDGVEEPLLCKKLFGYSEAEKRAINLKDNIHQGEWDLDLLADWTADLNINLGMELDNRDLSDKVIPEMELVHYEKYDYVVIACRNELDYNQLTRKLGIQDRVVRVHKKRTIKARAIWYDQMKAQLIDKEELKKPEDLH